MPSVAITITCHTLSPPLPPTTTSQFLPTLHCLPSILLRMALTEMESEDATARSESQTTGSRGAAECWEGHIRCPPQSWSCPLTEDQTIPLHLLSSLRLQLVPFNPSPPSQQSKSNGAGCPLSLPVLHLLSLLPLRCLSSRHRPSPFAPSLLLQVTPSLSPTSPLPPLSLLLSTILRPHHCLLLATVGRETEDKEEAMRMEMEAETSSSSSPPFSRRFFFAVYLWGNSIAAVEPLTVDLALASTSSLPEEWTTSPSHPQTQCEGLIGISALLEAKKQRKRDRREMKKRAKASLSTASSTASSHSSTADAPPAFTAPPPPPPPSLPSLPSPSVPPPLSPRSSNARLCVSLFQAAAARLREPVGEGVALALGLRVAALCRNDMGEEQWETQRLNKAQMTKYMKAHTSSICREFIQQQQQIINTTHNPQRLRTHQQLTAVPAGKKRKIGH